jgi:hypothetical protein
VGFDSQCRVSGVTLQVLTSTPKFCYSFQIDGGTIHSHNRTHAIS